METKERRGLTAVAWTVGGSMAAVFAFNGGAHLTWQDIATQALANTVFSGSCVALCVYGLPILVPPAHRHLRFPLDWVAIFAALIVFGATGSFIGGMVGIVSGFIPPGQSFRSWYWPSVRVAVYFTVIFGLSGTIIEQLRTRLASTTLALRTKERDEAEARRLAAEARLASLESRVDPHFLFNTLNSIAALVRDRPAEAERVIEQLSSLMRSSLDRVQPLVTVDEELEVVRSYLEIERVRFGERLRFCIECASDATRGRVPRMSLQTLVENSVKYAVSPARDGAAVSVKAERHEDRLRIAVEDDGPGFETSRLPEGHGLHLLKSRIALTFGHRGDLTISSRRGHTAVTLDLPFETKS